MKNFSKFYFTKFEFDKSNLKAKFYYSFDNEVFFDEVIDFSSEKFNLRNDIDSEVLENMLFNIHIALGISYYKAFPTENLVLESGLLDDNQIIFWKKFYTGGLGEFLYTNKIKHQNLFNFINASNKKYTKKDFKVRKKSLVALGGGKDSIVSMELLNNAGLEFDLCVFGKNDILKQNVANASGRKILLIKRQISPTLFELNNRGYYNGHVPITGIIAFVLELVAYIYDYKYIVLSNEKSANFGNTTWNGIDINHQYSKSLEFEVDFKKYVENYITGSVKYFSLLRGFYEIKIAKLFSSLGKKYFSVFSSCNNNFKIINLSEQNINKVWCNKCPKCAFVFSILRPYLNNNEILEIFGEDLFEKKELKNLFKELLGIKGIKPLECVGEAEEVIYSMYKSINKYSSNGLPIILDIFTKEVLNKLDSKKIKNLEKKFVTIDDEDIIPKEFKKLIFKSK
ncbi:MAG: hypothetical protein QM490_03555 [Candidatus Gracilibacteria bacterium]